MKRKIIFCKWCNKRYFVPRLNDYFYDSPFICINCKKMFKKGTYYIVANHTIDKKIKYDFYLYLKDQNIDYINFVFTRRLFNEVDKDINIDFDYLQDYINNFFDYDIQFMTEKNEKDLINR